MKEVLLKNMSLTRLSKVRLRKERKLSNVHISHILYEHVSKYSLNEISTEVWLHPGNSSNIEAFKGTYLAKECFLHSLSYQFGCFRSF